MNFTASTCYTLPTSCIARFDYESAVEWITNPRFNLIVWTGNFQLKYTTMAEEIESILLADVNLWRPCETAAQKRRRFLMAYHFCVFHVVVKMTVIIGKLSVLVWRGMKNNVYARIMIKFIFLFLTANSQQERRRSVCMSWTRGNLIAARESEWKSCKL